jgi:hypothetical protein
MSEIKNSEFYIDCWDMVSLTETERDALCNAVDAGDEETAESVVDDAYERLFGEAVN